MANNITIVQEENLITGEVLENVIIDLGDGNFISMLKSTYDEQQAKPDTGWTEPTLTKF